LTQVKLAGKRRRILRRMTTPKRRTLATAAQTLGGEQALADALGVDRVLLSTWLQAQVETPDAIYLAALEIVAKGPFNGTRRRT
jgi:transcriptional regulator with XRE-family HTH domain